MAAPANFDRLARIYRPLEYLAFGRSLERARFCLLDRLADRRSILVLGEGDGRCLERLVGAAPAARIHCLDASRAMLKRASARIAATEARSRVSLEQADLLAAELRPDRYDAAVTLFFLDCFTADQAAGIVGRVSASLRPGSPWLWADFAVPPRGLARLWGQGVLAVLYAFFRWQTGIPARKLPPAEDLIARAGFAPEALREFQFGLIRTRLFRRCGPGA